jgi:hypothetical protein
MRQLRRSFRSIDSHQEFYGQVFDNVPRAMQLETVKEWIRKHPLEAALGGAVTLVLLIVVVAALISDGGDGPIAGPSSTTVSTPVSTSPPVTVPDDLVLVEPVECGPLVTSEDIDAVLGLTELGGMFTFGQGEVCTHTPDPEGDLYVRTEPGHPNDFEPGATLVGVEGQFVDGVGVSALWFNGQDPETGDDVGVLSVSDNTTLGWLYFRVVLSRPDADDQTKLEAARALALAALPRFPGVVVEPELIVFEADDPNPALSSHSANLEAKVDSGQWTLGEGLRASLQAFTGQADPADVFLNPELVDQPAVSVVRQAADFVANNPNDPVAEEIDVILGRLFPTTESLEDQGAIAAPTAQAPYGLYLRQLAQEETDDSEQQEAYCQDVWSSPAPCLVEFPLDDLEAEYPGKYQLLVPFVTTNWGSTTPADTAQAMVESATLYESIGTMPKVQVLFTPEHPGTMVSPGYPEPDRCQVALGINAGEGSTLRQRVAVAIAYCLTGETLGDVWFENGLTWYLGARVYPNVDLEHEWADDLQNEELSTSILQRSYTNWSFFEFIHPFVGGEEAVLGLAGDFPQSANDFVHQYYLGLTDANIGDLGAGTIPYSPMAWELPISGPVEVPMVGEPYGVRRFQVTVDSGMKACVEYFATGPVESSWRTGAPGTPGSWESVPVELEGESVFVVTTTGAASLDMVVSKVVSADKECEEEPENGSSQTQDPVDPCCSSDLYRKTPPTRQDE